MNSWPLTELKWRFPDMVRLEPGVGFNKGQEAGVR